MTLPLDAADTIQEAVARVAALRAETRAQPELQVAATAIKRVQALRFAGTYADLLAGSTYRAATRFFLEELYSEKDYAQRDAQFARIAGPLQTFFPQRVVDTAIALAQLHVLTEELDHAMALAWAAQVPQAADDEASRYLAAWRTVARARDRDTQLATVLAVGRELERLVRMPGLRLALKMMRRPAHAAGLEALQAFLEAGFDTFAGLVKGPDRGATVFLDTITERETRWINQLFTQEPVQCAQQLRQCLPPAEPGQAPYCNEGAGLR